VQRLPWLRPIARGTRLGNPTGKIGSWAREGAEVSAQVRTAEAAKRSADLVPIIRDIESTGAQSLRQIAETLNQRVFQQPGAVTDLRFRFGAS
jgi:hypothetical protein